MRIKDLLDGGLLLIRVNVPNLELAAHGANEEVIMVDLVEEGRTLLVRDLAANGPAARLDVHIADQYCAALEAGNGQHC